MQRIRSPRVFHELIVGKAYLTRNADVDGLLQDSSVVDGKRVPRMYSGRDELNLRSRGFRKDDWIETALDFTELPPERRIGRRIVADALVENAHQGQAGFAAARSRFCQVLDNRNISLARTEPCVLKHAPEFIDNKENASVTRLSEGLCDILDKTQDVTSIAGRTQLGRKRDDASRCLARMGIDCVCQQFWHGLARSRSGDKACVSFRKSLRPDNSMEFIRQAWIRLAEQVPGRSALIP